MKKIAFIILSSLMMSYAKASKLTYDNNLTTLGYGYGSDTGVQSES